VVLKVETHQNHLESFLNKLLGPIPTISLNHASALKVNITWELVTDANDWAQAPDLVHQKLG
jgi:hypothetical protein